MIRNYHNIALQTNPGTMRKSHRTLTVTRHQEDKHLSKATSSFFDIKMIAKPEREQRNAHGTNT